MLTPHFSLLTSYFLLFWLAEIGPGNLGSWNESAQIAGHGKSFFQGHRASEWRHHGASAFYENAGDLIVRARGLPASVGKIGNARNVPNTPAVNSVATDAIPIEKPGDDNLLLLGAAHPKPGTSHFSYIRAVTACFAFILTKEGVPRRRGLRVRRKITETGEVQD